MQKILLAIVMILFGFGVQAQIKNDLNLVPVPAKMKINPGKFVFQSNTSIVLTSEGGKCLMR